jgi:hypothetical protein
MRWRLASQTTEGVIDEASGAGSQQGHGLAAARLCHKQSNSLRATIRGSGAVTMRLKVGSSIHGGVTDVPGVLPAETDRVRNAWNALEGPKRRRRAAAWAAQVTADRRPRCRPSCAAPRLQRRRSSRR